MRSAKEVNYMFKASKLLTLVIVFMMASMMLPVVSAEANLQPIILDSDRPVSPGATANYSVLVFNLGDESVNVTMAVSGVPTGWAVSFNESTFELEAGDDYTITMAVDVPENATKGDIETMTVIANGDRGTDSEATFSTEVGLGFKLTYTFNYPSTATALQVGTGDVAKLPIIAEADEGDLTYEVVLYCTPMTASPIYKAIWLCTNPEDPVGSELGALDGVTSSVNTNDWNVVYIINPNWSGGKFIYTCISPDIYNASVGQEYITYITYKLSGTTDDCEYAYPSGTTHYNQHLIVETNDYHIDFTSVDSSTQKAPPGGYVEYYFNLSNLGNSTADVEFILNITPFKDGIQADYMDWVDELGYYHPTSHDWRGAWKIQAGASNATPLFNGYAMEGSIEIEGEPGRDTSVFDRIRVHIPSNATTTDNASIVVSAHVLSSSKERAFSTWYAGNTRNGTNGTTGVDETESWFEANIWLILGISIAGVLSVGVFLLWWYSYRVPLKNKVKKNGWKCGDSDDSIEKLKKKHPKMTFKKQGDKICARRKK